jgi:hypothetical protein
MFCQAGLGANDVVEQFPVGRRLAYDGERGRLWVVCTRCRRWNLTPIEERWEALEECEKAFRSSRLRASTEHVGIARTASGLDLVRIGRPLRREFAFWRWGDRFGARRREALIWGGITGAAVTIGAVGNLATGGAAFWALMAMTNFGNLIRMTSGRFRVETDTGRLLTIRGTHVGYARFVEPRVPGLPALSVRNDWEEVTLTGERALRGAAVILPRLNRDGAKDELIRGAVDAIEARGGPEGYVAATWGDRTVVESRVRRPLGAAGRPGVLGRLPLATRIGLEMALHEEEERRALNGELAGLEAMWRAAEEIASISDNLLLPASWPAFKRRHGAAAGRDPAAERHEDT